MIGYLIDQIPWWVYLVGYLTIIGVLLYLFSPVLIPIWEKMPLWMKVLLFAIGGIFLAFIKGRNTGHDNAVKEAEKRNARAEQTREEIHNEVQKIPSNQLDKRLDKWMRPDD